MNLPYRTYINGATLEAFKAGLAEVLGYPEPAQVIRLATRLQNRRPTIIALIGIPGKPGGRYFELPATGELTRQRATALGAEMGRAVEGWLRPEIQEPLQRNAAALSQDVWAIHEMEELAQDAVDHWEATWRSHLGGKLHIKARAALVTLFAEELMKVVAAKAQERAAPKGRKGAPEGALNGNR